MWGVNIRGNGMDHGTERLLDEYSLHGNREPINRTCVFTWKEFKIISFKMVPISYTLQEWELGGGG